ncbi:toprim domain-containing protein [Arcobacter cloacae]|uniref:Uncharacterized protein n=1 Tax=Arcobacter cloacae TaxID=1054034 RepID=A0A6M8NGN1_9BACT|nr:toprim domain-containing protein [Arcobacter cloacae]QKF90485.1 hypothetical protein ACLO_2005 [Arcobacter cloacae]RXI37005.1 hypothetical protein CP963_13900 [Arcobacter cloacae]
MIADKEIIMNAISNLGFEVFRNGQFHWNSSNTPDMYINQDGTIHCWTSSPFKNNTTNHGDLIDFLQMTNVNKTFKEAKEEAERLTGLTLPSIESYKDNGYTVDNTNRKTGFIDEEFIKNFDVARVENFERYKELLNQALPSLDFKQQKEIALKYQIGYIKQSDRLSMPIRDEENRIVTLWKYNKNPNTYTNDKGVEVTPSKVLFTKGRDRCPFNLYDIQEYRKDMHQEIFLCGGEKDTLNMIGNGYRAITLGSENENLKDKYKPFFQDLKIVIAYDNDKAGKDGANKIFNQLQGVAKEVKVWNWENIKKSQGLNLTKGFDMTDYLSEIKKLNLEFDKTNYLGNLNKEIKMEKEDLDEKIEIFRKNENELDKVSEKIQEQEQKIKDLKSNQFQKEDIKVEQQKKEKDNSDFFKKVYQFKSTLSPNIGLINDDFSEKIKEAEKIESDIKDVKDKSERVKSKIDDLSNSSLSQSDKDRLFAEIEKDILNLKLAVEKLKEENLSLSKELELLLEKNKIESQKSGLQKENESLASKIEALRNKTQNSKTEFQEKTTENKITYKESKESQLIKDYESLDNTNQKEK